MTKRRLTKKQRDYWFLLRYDQLLLEGFAPEEAAVVALTRISSPQVKRLRKQRLKVFWSHIWNGLDPRDAIQATRTHFRGTDDEILTWADFKRLLYPKADIFAFRL